MVFKSKTNSLTRKKTSNFILPNMWRHRDLIKQFMWREVVSKYKGANLGMLWSFINPLVMLLVYTFVFGIVFKSKWGIQLSDSQAEFALTLFSGIITYSIFSDSLNKASGLIVLNPNYVKKVIFPLEIMPVASLGAILVHSAISLLIFIAGKAIFIGNINWILLLYPIILIPLLMLCMGLSWFLASLGVFIRDMGQTIVIITQILFYMTPVFYPISAVPKEFQNIMLLNPISTIVENGRNVLMWGTLPDWYSLGKVTVISFIIMEIGYFWFIKTKNAFADVI